MNRIDLKKLIIPNIPYLLFVWLFDKAAQAFRLSPGADLSEKLLALGTGFSAAFSNAAPSLHPMDLLIGIAGAVLMRSFTRPRTGRSVPSVARSLLQGLIMSNTARTAGSVSRTGRQRNA